MPKNFTGVCHSLPCTYQISRLPEVSRCPVCAQTAQVLPITLISQGMVGTLQKFHIPDTSRGRTMKQLFQRQPSHGYINSFLDRQNIRCATKSCSGREMERMGVLKAVREHIQRRSRTEILGISSLTQTWTIKCTGENDKDSSRHSTFPCGASLQFIGEPHTSKIILRSVITLPTQELRSAQAHQAAS